MKWLQLSCLLALAGHAACARAETEASEAQVDPAVAAIFAPYSVETDGSAGDADWDRPVFSAETTDLIAQWKLRWVDWEVAELQDFAWFCGCQDWDNANFRAVIEPHGAPVAGRIEVPVAVNLGWDTPDRHMRLVMEVENGKWLLDDLYWEDSPDGLKAQLKQAICSQPGSGN